MPTYPASAAPPPNRRPATWWDRLAIALLGATGCALSFDALRQMATAVHVRHPLTFLFPVVIDGFIAYGIRALLLLREAPKPARLYAWTLFIAATCASIWANSLHAVNLNRPGATALRLDDSTVAVLSAVAPLALAGATHLHILITRYSTTRAPAPASGTRALVQDRTHPAPKDPGSTPSPPAAADSPHDPRVRQEREQDGNPLPSAGGRPPLASMTRLVDVIQAAHPDGSGLTRDSARKAIQDAGLGAGTDRLTEAMALARQHPRARQHPSG
jgi:hypothetical protein